MDYIVSMAATLTRPSKIHGLERDIAKLQDALLEKKRQLEALLTRKTDTAKKKKEKKTTRVSPVATAQKDIAATEDLRVTNGNLSAVLVARAYGISLSQLSDWLGKSRQAVTKTPDADSLQQSLNAFERAARLRSVLSTERFRKWLRMPNQHLDGKAPLDLLASGDRQIVADLVEDMLAGSPG